MSNALRRIWHRIRGQHAWEWKPALFGADSGMVYGPWLVCQPCDEMRALDREPPLEHPDSMTVEWPEAVEEWLAELDQELFPEEAV